MFEAITEMYIDEDISLNSNTWTDVIVGQLTYRVHHNTEQQVAEYYEPNPDIDAECYYTYDCTISNIELMDEHCVVLTEVTSQVPDWFATRLALLIEETALEQNQ